MKTSLIINPVAFRAELYKCFFWYRPIKIHGKTFIAVPSYVGTDFVVSYFNVDDRDDKPGVDPRNFHKLRLGDADYNYKFSANDCVAMRSTSPEDYYNMFFVECELIEKEMKKWVKNESPGHTIYNTWMSVNIPPKDEEEGCSKDVLIDMNGKRKDFQVGWYDHDNKEWRFHASDTSNLELDKLEWKKID